MYVNREYLIEFIEESNRIEGIRRKIYDFEITAHHTLFACPQLSVADICDFVKMIEPRGLLRDRIGMDVRVGDHIAPAGGLNIVIELEAILEAVNTQKMTPFESHCAYEALHPFIDGNGRSGRAIWLWAMNGGRGLTFLHNFYYQTLDSLGDRK